MVLRCDPDFGLGGCAGAPFWRSFHCRRRMRREFGRSVTILCRARPRSSPPPPASGGTTIPGPGRGQACRHGPPVRIASDHQPFPPPAGAQPPQTLDRSCSTGLPLRTFTATCRGAVQPPGPRGPSTSLCHGQAANLSGWPPPPATATRAGAVPQSGRLFDAAAGPVRMDTPTAPLQPPAGGLMAVAIQPPRHRLGAVPWSDQAPAGSPAATSSGSRGRGRGGRPLPGLLVAGEWPARARSRPRTIPIAPCPVKQRLAGCFARAVPTRAAGVRRAATLHTSRAGSTLQLLTDNL